MKQKQSMLLFIFSIIVLLVFLYVLFVPITCFIDTSTNQYYIRVGGLAKADIEADEVEVFKIHLTVLFFDFSFYPLKSKGDTIKKKSKTSKKRIKKNNPVSLKKVIRVLRSFTIKQFQMDIDTGDCITNAKLYPCFAFLNFYCGSQLDVNFNGRNRVLLFVENRPIRLIRSFINI
ncbi:hypothetical protein [Formosa sp. Hel1_31_208]|uniref:hypothetical protein n=1 Tax=Formosa sp. Hel1_31_208 TaxID=1798225 RepID=UPI001E582B72|nr:hypothetical protein [Formosa sp. Hel1_31_208]